MHNGAGCNDFNGSRAQNSTEWERISNRETHSCLHFYGMGEAVRDVSSVMVPHATEPCHQEVTENEIDRFQLKVPPPAAACEHQQVIIPAALESPLGRYAATVQEKGVSSRTALKRLRERRAKFSAARKTLNPVAIYQDPSIVLSLNPIVVLE